MPQSKSDWGTVKDEDLPKPGIEWGEALITGPVRYPLNHCFTSNRNSLTGPDAHSWKHASQRPAMATILSPIMTRPSRKYDEHRREVIHWPCCFYKNLIIHVLYENNLFWPTSGSIKWFALSAELILLILLLAVVTECNSTIYIKEWLDCFNCVCILQLCNFRVSHIFVLFLSYYIIEVQSQEPIIYRHTHKLEELIRKYNTQ